MINSKIRLFTSTFITLFFTSVIYADTQPPVNVSPTVPASAVPMYKKTNADIALGDQVLAAINKNIDLKTQHLSATSVEGVISLDGTVQTKEQEEMAINIAKGVSGVKEVKSNLTITFTTENK